MVKTMKKMLVMLACLAYCVSAKFHLHAMSSMPIRYGESRPTFFNDGRLYGWDNKHEENDGEMEEVRVGCFDNHIDSDSHCLRFSQVISEKFSLQTSYYIMALISLISLVYFPLFICRRTIRNIEVDITLR